MFNLTAIEAQNLINLLRKVQNLGLTFDIGNAYIRREYINQQTALNAEINELIRELIECT
jgi:hypothetical protein